jgi:GT2 family glycosyltransferase
MEQADIQGASAGASRTSLRGVAAICTKNRPLEIAESVTAVHRVSPGTVAMVIDASESTASEEVCARLAEETPGLKVDYHRAIEPGTARQRNQAVEICREQGIDVIHFLDDDTEVLDGYFEAIEGRFAREPELMGIGGIILNQPPLTYPRIKRFFQLAGRPGQVLRSGRNSLGQYPDAKADDKLDWLVGCSMSFRMSAFEDGLRFDGRLKGYSLGEDLDLSFRLSREHPIAVEPAATCYHHMTSTGRHPMRSHAHDRTVFTHRWVIEQKKLGLSMPLFWWSVLGDCLLHAGHGIVGRSGGSWDQALGVVDGVREILRSGSGAA